AAKASIEVHPLLIDPRPNPIESRMGAGADQALLRTQPLELNLGVAPAARRIGDFSEAAVHLAANQVVERRAEGSEPTPQSPYRHAEIVQGRVVAALFESLPPLGRTPEQVQSHEGGRVCRRFAE